MLLVFLPALIFASAFSLNFHITKKSFGQVRVPLKGDAEGWANDVTGHDIGWTWCGHWDVYYSRLRQIFVSLRLVLAKVFHVWCHDQCHRSRRRRCSAQRGRPSPSPFLPHVLQLYECLLRWVRPRDWVLLLRESHSSMTERLSCFSCSLET